jgi:uncharacterized membrane protein
MDSLLVILILLLLTLVACPILLAVHWVKTRRRMTALEEQIRLLTRRVWELETPEPKPAPIRAPAPEPEPLPAPRSVPPPAPTPTPPEPEPILAPPVYEPLSAPAPAGPPLGERIRAWVGNEEWEALVGGSLLNKLGALVLVVGIALFLGYSFTQVSAAGRVALAATVSAAMLGGGVFLERKPGYRVFSRGLMGGGWAGLYATAYAMYAVPATQVIPNAALGSAILLAVAAAMTAHSLRYRSQAATSVAFFTAFAALAAAPSTPFSVVALVPLSAAVAVLARRFEWYSMALFGMIATYGTAISSGSSGAPVESTQALFTVYWAVFEIFDVLRARDGRGAQPVSYLFPLNAAAFLGVTYAAWAAKSPQRLWEAAAVTAALYLASAAARMRLAPVDGPLRDRAMAGSYEGALTLAALLGGLAICGRVPGVWMSAGLALMAEILYLCGVRWRAGYVRGLGLAAFAASLGRLALFDVSAVRGTVLGHAMAAWTPGAVLHAALFYWNRGVAGRARNGFSYAAAALLLAAVAAEMPMASLGGAWVIAGFALWEAGARWGIDLRNQGYFAAAVGCAYGSLVYAVQLQAGGWVGPAAMAMLAVAALVRWRGVDFVTGAERKWVPWGIGWALGAVAAVLAMRAAPEPWVALAWCAAAVGMHELGRAGWPRELEAQSRWMLAAALAAAVVRHADGFVKFPAAAVWASYLGASAAALYFAWRESGAWGRVRETTAAAAAVFAALAAWLALPDVGVAMAWSAIGLAAVELAPAEWRWIGRGALAAAFGRLFFANFTNGGETLGVSHRALSVVPVAAAQLAAWLRLRDRASLWMATGAVFVLLRFEMGHMPAAMGWAAMAVALLAAGSRCGVADWTLQGGLVAILAALRCWTANFQSPELFGDPSMRWMAGSFVIAVFYAARALPLDRVWPAEPRWLERLPAPAASLSLVATALLTALLYQEVSGSVLTMVWGIEGLALLAAGFPLRDRALRLPGLALLLFCIGKLFVFDLRNLETMYRILSFVALGVILLGVSWMYARFRTRIKELL